VSWQPISIDELAREARAFDDAVMRTADIDYFCSSSDWVIPAHVGLMPERTPWIRRDERGYVAMAIGEGPEGERLLQPLEACWGLGSPFVGDDPQALVWNFMEECLDKRDAWDGILITGIRQDSLLFKLLVTAFGAAAGFRIYLGPPTQRFAASLRGGVDGFLSRRSRNFRRALRRAQKRIQDSDVEFITIDNHGQNAADLDALYDRILRVEERSWKGMSATGLESEPMRAFYRDMLPRIYHRGAMRLIFARRPGPDGPEDIGYVLGAVLNNSYRGLQFSFDARFRELSVGNLLQYQQIAHLCDEGIEEYDLGTEAMYKERWAEGGLHTASMIIRPPSHSDVYDDEHR